MNTKFESTTRMNEIDGVTIFLANVGRKPPFLFEVAEAIFAEVITLTFRRRATKVCLKLIY